MDDDDFLEAVEADNASTPPADPQPPADTPPAVEPPPADDTPPPADGELVLQPEQIVPPEKAPVMVPIGVLHEVRDELKTVKADLSRFQQSQQPPEAQRPDEYEDPDGARAFDRAEVSRALQNVTLNTSERFARKEHGAETVETAKQWALQKFASEPLYQQQILNDPDPYERVVTDWRREQVFTEVKDPKEFEQFKAWKQANNALQQPGGQPPPPNQPPQIPSPSLASAPSAGEILTEPAQSEEDMFKEAFPKG